MRVAAAQPQLPIREQQQRQVVIPANPREPVPGVWVATHVSTTLVFDAPIDRASVEVSERATRFRLVVRGRYKDGASPTHATFARVSYPTRVDTEVEVVRRPRTVETLETELAEKDAQLAALRVTSGPAKLVFSGRTDVKGVQAQQLPVRERKSARVHSFPLHSFAFRLRLAVRCRWH
jgi:hypothetical protein